jgi:hypothetical protein
VRSSDDVVLVGLRIQTAVYQPDNPETNPDRNPDTKPRNNAVSIFDDGNWMETTGAELLLHSGLVSMDWL